MFVSPLLEPLGGKEIYLPSSLSQILIFGLKTRVDKN